MRFFASCPRSLEDLLAEELRQLGIEDPHPTAAGVAFEATIEAALPVLMHSRLASRLLLQLAAFDCEDEAALYRGVEGIDWTRHLRPGQTLLLHAHGRSGSLRHSGFAAQRAKDAIVDRLRREYGERPNVEREDPDLRLDLLLRRGRAVLSIDLGGPLHRRGWRQGQGDAPLKENLAAAMLLRGGWPELARAGGGLFDPMCGSGTLLIEAACMAAEVAPGLGRWGTRPPTGWAGFPQREWEALRVACEHRATQGRQRLQPVLLGCDADAAVLEAARRNARAAGVEAAIRLVQAPLDAAPTPAADEGLVACNPPWDRRLEADAALYRALGDCLRARVPGWRAVLLCGDEDLARATGLRARKTWRLASGPQEALLLRCESVVEGPEAPRVPRPWSASAQMLANRLRRNPRLLRRWREREGVSCYRVYDADLPEYAAAIDVYVDADRGDRYLHVQEYAAPASIPEATARRRLGELLRVAGEVLEVPRPRMAIKRRVRGKGGRKYGLLDHRGVSFMVEEGGLRFEVNLFDHLDTGLFLDHRPVRAALRTMAAGLDVLNLFCYTASASVHMAAGGARSTTSVDLSATYLEWAGRNLAANGFRGAAHRLVQADVLPWLEAERRTWGLIFCDPPTFSNSARAAGDFDVQRDHVRLIRACVERLEPGGVLVFSNNYRRFRLDQDALAGLQVEPWSPARSLPPDFARDPRIHRVWSVRRAPVGRGS